MLGAALRGLFPRRGLLGGLGDRRGTGLGQAEDLLAAGLLGGDEALVGEQLEGGVDRARAGAPRAAAARGELLDDLVAVHGLLGEQAQDGRADVAAAGALAAGTAEAVRVAAHAERGLEAVPSERAMVAALVATAGFGFVAIAVHVSFLPSSFHRV